MGAPLERAVGEISRRVAGAVAAQVDGHAPELVAQHLSERIEQPRRRSHWDAAGAVGTVAAPIERGDLDAVVRDGDRPGVHRAQRTGLP